MLLGRSKSTIASSWRKERSLKRPGPIYVLIRLIKPLYVYSLTVVTGRVAVFRSI